MGGVRSPAEREALNRGAIEAALLLWSYVRWVLWQGGYLRKGVKGE